MGVRDLFPRRRSGRHFFPFYFCLWPCRDSGFSLTEVLVAMTLLATGLLGSLWGFQWAQRGLEAGREATRALALAESMLEAKRATRWRFLLREDTDGDGVLDGVMRDDGGRGDERAGDGVYTASREVGGIRLTWSVQPDRPGPLWRVGSAILRARAEYEVPGGGRRTVELDSLRANPNYIGRR